MKIIYALLITFLMLNGSFAESVTQCFGVSNLPGESIKSLWISDATLKDQDIHVKLSRKLSNSLFYSLRDNNVSILFQDISEGKGTVFAFRDQFPGWPGLSDTSNIRYFTVHIPDKLDKNREIDLSKEKDTLAVLTKGSPAFRNFCYGYMKEGKIRISKLNGGQDEFDNKMSKPIFDKIGDESILMDIDVKVKTKHSNQAWDKYCGSCVLQGKFVFYKSSLKDMLQE